jgi:hypothetical protein
LNDVTITNENVTKGNELDRPLQSD